MANVLAQFLYMQVLLAYWDHMPSPAKAQGSPNLVPKYAAVDQEEWWQLQEHGLVHLRGLFGPHNGDGYESIRDAGLAIDRLWDLRSSHPEVGDLGIQISLGAAGGHFNPGSYRLADVPQELRSQSYRIYLHPQQLVTDLGSVWGRLLFESRLRDKVSELIGAEAVPTTFLLFEHGTEQGLHFDTWYALGDDRPGGMVGVWIALEDVDCDNGPLRYVPGSHKLLPYLFHPEAQDRKAQMAVGNQQSFKEFESWMQEAMTRKNLSVVELCPIKAGDVVIWHEQLYHGGAKILNASRSRRSFIAHFKAGGWPWLKVLAQAKSVLVEEKMVGLYG